MTDKNLLERFRVNPKQMDGNPVIRHAPDGGDGVIRFLVDECSGPAGVFALTLMGF